MDISNRDKWYRIYVVPVFVNDALDHSFSDQIKLNMNCTANTVWLVKYHQLCIIKYSTSDPIDMFLSFPHLYTEFIGPCVAIEPSRKIWGFYVVQMDFIVIPIDLWSSSKGSEKLAKFIHFA